MRKENIRNLLIVGRTNCGKSTLASVLSDIAEESEYTNCKTKNFLEQYFEWKGAKYRVVDIIGVEKTRLSKYLVPEVISQVLFVVDGIFTEEEVKEIFERDVVKYITIVRTKFSNFKNKVECEKDRKQLREENEKVKSCSIVYVDNPPTNILVDDKDDEEIVRINKKRRKQSRDILLDHLEKVCREKSFTRNL